MKLNSSNLKTPIFCLIVWSIVLSNCTYSDKSSSIQRFEKISTEQSGVFFSNDLNETDSLNYFTYPYLYMGGGVAIGDINNDGLADIFFSGNLVSNKLYLNKGDLSFEDITEKAHVSGDTKKWYSGVSFVDVNADGYVDIYACVSGLFGDKKNELFINNGDLTFEEKAEEYGLADLGNSVQASFFDYDHDGDLDVYVANYPITSFTTPNHKYRHLINTVTNENSDHLFRNDGEGKFVNATEESGLLSFGLSLSACVADFNEDGWDDIYVSNDFSTPDYFYINNGDGTFRNELKSITNQTSFYGMGTDAGDINNDGLMDLIQVDMSAPDNRRTKANMASMNPALFWGTVNNGFHYQYMYNCMQLNQGIVDDLPTMSNVAWISGLSSTDWSWTPIFADFDNDGWKDLFIANGTRKEINNRDYFKKIEERIRKAPLAELKRISDSIPSEPIDNFMFRNSYGKGFEKVNENWNISFEGFSNGASYADLDNDGDLDLVVNNIDDVALIYKNNTSDFASSNYLRVNLEGQLTNKNGIGAEVRIYTNGEMQMSQVNVTRGFQSSVEPILHFGLGATSNVDSLKVFLENKEIVLLTDVEANQVVNIPIQGLSNIEPVEKIESKALFANLTDENGIDFDHMENNFYDFDFQVLLPHLMSTFGPALATGDVTGDGLDDFYIGAAVGSNGRLFVQQAEGGFSSIDFQTKDDLVYEDLGAEFFDADQDGDLDLYIVSGGNEYEKGDPSYQDRLYLNDEGNLTLTSNVLPDMPSSGSCVRPFDYDGDGDMDLFIGGRLDPRNYPFPGTSYLLQNNSDKGQVSFVDVTENRAKGLQKIGMVTDAMWTDINADGNFDLLIVGEWMGITVFEFESEQFFENSDEYFTENTTGWWFSVEGEDMDQDGDIDYVFGNLGKNYKYQASPGESFNLYVDDFDKNGKHDIVLSYHNFGEEFPVRGRQCSSQQIPAIKVAYQDYNSFSTASVQEIFGDETLENSLSFKVESFASIYVENQGDGRFEFEELPWEAQIAPINDLLIDDFTEDGVLDILIVGNLFAAEVETPRADAGIGFLLEGDGHGNFQTMKMNESGILIPYDTKNLAKLNTGDKKAFVAASSNGPVQLFVKQ